MLHTHEKAPSIDYKNIKNKLARADLLRNQAYINGAWVTGSKPSR